MPRKYFAITVVMFALAIVVLSSVVSEQVACGEPRGGEKSLQPGGWPARIRSYYAHGTPGGLFTAIPSVGGEHGLIITGIDIHLAATDSTIYMTVDPNDGSGPVTVYSIKLVFTNGHPPYLRFDPGIPVASGSTVRLQSVSGGTEVDFTLTGYEY